MLSIETKSGNNWKIRFIWAFWLRVQTWGGWGYCPLGRGPWRCGWSGEKSLPRTQPWPVYIDPGIQYGREPWWHEPVWLACPYWERVRLGMSLFSVVFNKLISEKWLQPSLEVFLKLVFCRARPFWAMTEAIFYFWLTITLQNLYLILYKLLPRFNIPRLGSQAINTWCPNLDSLLFHSRSFKCLFNQGLVKTRSNSVTQFVWLFRPRTKH